MYLTVTDLINAKLAAGNQLADSDIIAKLIAEDMVSKEKANMRMGEKYYVGEHDILAKDFRQSVISETIDDPEKGEREERQMFANPNRSNHHNVNAFHKILVDQKAAYLVAREPTISVQGAEKDNNLKQYETLLTKWSDEEFNDMLLDWVVGAGNKGYEALHIYYDSDGSLQYCIVPANELIPIYDSQYQRELEQVIRYYDFQMVRGNEKVLRKKVEWWTKSDVTYYIENDNHAFVLDSSYSFNPAPHWWQVTTLDGYEKRREGHNWGQVPFIILANNSKRTSDLTAIKGLIDAYDLLSSEGTNNLLDLVDLYWVVAGYGGETAKSIVKKLQVNRAVHISDPNGKVEAKQVTLPIDGRLEWLKMLRRDIYHFGQGVDTDADKFGNAPSGVSLKFQYTQLDLKANALAAKLKQAVKAFFWFITNNYNRNNNIDYDSSLIDVTINKTMITNDAETVAMICQSKGVVSDKTLLAKHPFVDDVNAELKELEAQEAKEIKHFADYQGLGESHAKE